MIAIASNGHLRIFSRSSRPDKAIVSALLYTNTTSDTEELRDEGDLV